MADFFLDEPVAQPPVAASDPAADFLATEQAELDRDGHFMIFEKLAFFVISFTNLRFWNGKIL